MVFKTIKYGFVIFKTIYCGYGRSWQILLAIIYGFTIVGDMVVEMWFGERGCKPHLRTFTIHT